MRFARAPKLEMGYAEMKAHFTLLVMAQARKTLANSPDFARRAAGVLSVDVLFTWRERNRHRDPDGVRAASKFVLDGLVAGGVLRTDGAAYVHAIGDQFAYHASQDVGVEVEIFDANAAMVPLFSDLYPFRFPDLNEILAARGRDGALTERTRQARRAR